MSISRKFPVLSAVLCVFGSLLAAQTAPIPAASARDAQAHIEKVKACLPEPIAIKNDPHACRTLAERMAELHVPGVSIAVVHNGVIEWAQGFGVQRVGGPPVTADTLFQAGSISKPLAAMAALHLVQQGKLSLDSDVNAKLMTWKIPASSAAPGAVVTLRELLTHTAGFNVHGFPGYEANAPVPTLVQVLNGEKPANTDPIRLESPPGKEPKYSGGGYTVMQQLVLDVAKEPFPKLLHDTVLAPIGMTHSTYEQPLPAELRAAAATPYSDDGAAVPGGAHTYPEMAAAGLWTTPSDLARYMIENQRSLNGKANHVLSRELTEEMVTRGLGLQIGGSVSNPYFSHGGVNEGFESLFAAYEHKGEGAAVMTNAEGGMRLASEIMSSIAVTYDWPDFRPAVRTVVEVDRTVLARYVGTYELTPDFSITFTLDGNQLMTQATNQPKFPVFPESKTKFFLKVVDAEVEFFSDDKGQVTHMVLHQNGHEMKGVKK
ncbi:MAG TPA: serine hydrolase [Bryobacteraceae bacterium]|nr:serine hydrolase [Bryobacteraceae bacterium]HZW96356.1 serine hydrolase [Candidatus Eremiobacteraceae bacterium]